MRAPDSLATDVAMGKQYITVSKITKIRSTTLARILVIYKHVYTSLGKILAE